MNPYETLATVGDNGEIRIDSVPFAPGTSVDVTIQPAERSAADVAAAEARAAQLFAALDKSRNTHSIGNFQREEFYDRNVLR